ncbi:putative transcription initiation factor TFIID subunit 6 [Jimgerdemannia flammicorona]|uniref:Putative transcription initiation factor TFIID subunit 6 n=1 Tax=Jimgerdemannia flammicorona TaxID=994334 RepID=A0A433CXW3_9FUNG|nr:putative transcription initiation factor TFIID subunit 6 [Jimgerdemannia flammicorona]
MLRECGRWDPTIGRRQDMCDAKTDLLSKRIKTSTTNGTAAGDTNVDVKPLVKHVLSKELQMYFERITEAVLSEEERLRSQAFESLRQDPGLHQLLPYFVQFVSEKVGDAKHQESGGVERNAVHDSVTAGESSPVRRAIRRRICENPQEDHWLVRDFAARLMAQICQRYGKAYHTLQPRITKTLLRAFLDPAKPLTTHYGAIIGLSELGPEVVRVLVVPNVKAYGILLQREMAQGGNAVRIKEAGKCHDALLNALRKLIEKEKKMPGGDEMEGLDDVDEATADALRDRLGDLFARQILGELHSRRVVLVLIDTC